jgi:hypothetical protein
MQFMAIEVLQGNRYTYRHRLESFSRPYLDVHSSHTPNDQCIQQGDQPFGTGVTGTFIGKARTGLQHRAAFGTFCFLKYLF